MTRKTYKRLLERKAVLKRLLIGSPLQEQYTLLERHGKNPEATGKGSDPLEDALQNIQRNTQKLCNKERLSGGQYLPLPDKDSFIKPAEFYATLFHELAHSTGHESRLKRKGITDLLPFGSERYSKEELIAELGAAFLCGHTGIADATLQNQAAYIAAWKKKLEEDPAILLQAAAQGQKAADYILGRTPEKEIPACGLKGGQRC